MEVHKFKMLKLHIVCTYVHSLLYATEIFIDFKKCLNIQMNLSMSLGTASASVLSSSEIAEATTEQKNLKMKNIE